MRNEIATYKECKLLNKRTEIINTCRHRSKYKLANKSSNKIPLQCLALNCNVYIYKDIYIYIYIYKNLKAT